MTSLTEGSPQRGEAYNESKDEHNRSETSKHVTSVRSVCFSNGSENLGLREVTTASEQDVPGIAEVEDLEDPKRTEESHSTDGEGSKNEEPWFVAESSCDVHDYNTEQQDEEERLETASIQHQVHLRMCIERESNQQIGQQHGEE